MKYKLRKLLRRLEFFFWRIKKRQSEYVIFSEHDVEMRMVADSHIAMFAVTRDFEPEERKFFVSKLDKVDCFINIGANVGFYVLLAAIKKKDIEIHAFEPMSLNMEKMRRNLELNSLEKRNNIHLYKIGAGDVSGEFDLFEDDELPEMDSHYSLIKKTDTRLNVVEKVRVEPLDAVLPMNVLSQRALIWIDAEGFEKKIIEGWSNLKLARKGTMLVIEIMSDNTELYQKLKAIGF